MIILITGGSKSGKSSMGEKILASFEGEKYYLATMQPDGKEANLAIERHRKMREGKGFLTIEKTKDVGKLSLPENCSILLECMGNLCANEMFQGEEMKNPVDKIVNDISSLSKNRNMIVISNIVGEDGIAYEEGTDAYIKAIGEINQKLAEISDTVIEVVYGLPIFWKGINKWQ